ncbi:MAG: dTMP kinase [Erythrobacter sp.]|uniref:dTMP kinase n=1 Tax=Erythrobacter sp. TaxID=1042 RepID=UPI003297B671
MNGITATGKFIALEGGEGTGKSTQGRMLAETLRSTYGLDVTVTREPGGTPGAEAIRALLLDPPGEGWSPQAEALLFAAARADHVDRLIRPRVAEGAWVISDRFVDSSRAYQGGAGGLGDDAITALHKFGSHGMRPDCTILLEVDDAVRRERLAARDGDNSDAIGGRSAEYHDAVAQSFRELAKSDPAGFKFVDGTGSPDEVHRQMILALSVLLEELPR